MSRRDSTVKDLREGSKLSMGHGKDRRLSIVSNAGASKGEHLLFMLLNVIELCNIECGCINNFQFQN